MVRDAVVRSLLYYGLYEDWRARRSTQKSMQFVARNARHMLVCIDCTECDVLRAVLRCGEMVASRSVSNVRIPMPGPNLNRELCAITFILCLIITAVTVIAIRQGPELGQDKTFSLMPNKDIKPKTDIQQSLLMEWKALSTGEQAGVVFSLCLIVVAFSVPRYLEGSADPFRTAGTWGCLSAGAVGIIGVLLAEYAPFTGFFSGGGTPWSAYRLALIPVHTIGLGMAALMIGGAGGALHAMSHPKP